MTKIPEIPVEFHPPKKTIRYRLMKATGTL